MHAEHDPRARHPRASPTRPYSNVTISTDVPRAAVQLHARAPRAVPRRRGREALPARLPAQRRSRAQLFGTVARDPPTGSSRTQALPRRRARARGSARAASRRTTTVPARQGRLHEGRRQRARQPRPARAMHGPGRRDRARPRRATPERILPAPELLGPDEELVAGRRPVEEVFAAGRVAHRLLVVPQRRNALEQLVLHATRLRIPIVEVEGGSLTAIAGFDGHQGVALVVEPRASPRSPTCSPEPRSAARRRSCSSSIRSRIRRTSARCCAAPRRPASTAWSSRPGGSAALRGGGQGIGRSDRASPPVPGRRPAGRPRRPPRPRPADRRIRGGRAADRPSDRPARTAGHRRRQRGSRPGTDGPPPLRHVHADPDAGPDRVAQRGGRRLGPAVRGRRPAGSRRARSYVPGGRRVGRYRTRRNHRAVLPRPSRPPAEPPGQPDSPGPPPEPAAIASDPPVEPRQNPPRKRPRPGREPPARRPGAGRSATGGSPEHLARHALDPSTRPALSFHGAERVICGMALPVTCRRSSIGRAAVL